MNFRPPSLAAAHKFIHHLDPNTYSTRTDAIQNLKSLLNSQDPEEVIGGIILESEKIEVEYDYKLVPSPIYSASRSRLYNELNSKACLNVSLENPLTANQKLIYLWQYYRARKNALAESKQVKDDSVMEGEFAPVVDRLISQLDDFKAVLAARPSLIEIEKRLKTRPSEYESECKSRWFSPNIKHVQFNKLIQFFNSDLMEKVIASFDECNTAHARDQFKYSVYYGALLFIMKEIELDCAGASLRRATNSSLYQFCQRTISIEHTDDIPDIVKLNFFVDFGKFISLAKANKDVMKLLQSYIGTSFFSDANSFLDNINSRLQTLLTEESYLSKCVNSLAHYAVQTILVTACLEVGSGIYAAGIGVNVLPFVFGKLGRQFLGGAVGERLAIMFAKQMEPAFMTNMYAGSMGLLGKKAYNWVFPPVDPIFNACEVSKKFRLKINEEISDLVRKPDSLLLALVELPSTRISEKVRQRVTDIIIAPALTCETVDPEKEVRLTLKNA